MRLCNGTARLRVLVVLFAAAGAARAQPGGDCGALANLKCPVCGCIGALRVEGQDSVLELAAADKSGAKFNFDRMDHILTKV